MKETVIVYKSQGLTPLETIKLFKEKYPIYQSQKIAYAGRLDPMAEGLLLLLIGEECKKRTQYQELSKQYEFEILFGVQTDTHDLLGLITKNNFPTKVSKKLLKETLLKQIGKQTQEYPVYSSKAVNGKKLFEYAKSNTLHLIQIPTKEIEVYDAQFLKTRILTKKDLQREIMQRISRVSGNFRQEKIAESWKKFFEEQKNTQFTLYKCEIFCSSGTYVRKLADQIGKELGTQAIAFSIIRTRLGSCSSASDATRAEKR